MGLSRQCVNRQGSLRGSQQSGCSHREDGCGIHISEGDSQITHSTGAGRLSGFHNIFRFSEQESDRTKRIPRVSLSPLAFRRDTVTSTDSSSMRKKWEDFYVPTSRLGFAFSEMAGSRDVIGIIMFSPTSI